MRKQAEARNGQGPFKDTDKGGKAVSSPRNKPAANTTGTFIGLNLWTMTPAPNSAPVKSRGFTHPVEDPSGSRDWTARRVTLNHAVHQDDWVRFSFEAAPAGYLYVIDRDVFANQELGEPVLIFPTHRIRAGNNFIAPAHVVQIPDPQDKPEGLRVDLAKPNQTGILLILMVTPKPIPDIVVGEDKQTLPERWLTRWEAQWSTDVEVSADPSLEGALETAAEKAAVEDPSHLLGGTDRAPIMLFHRRRHPNEPIYAKALIKVEAGQ
jgi:hypothetical protein